MGSGIKSGVNWTLDGKTIAIFGDRGCKLSDSCWGVNVFDATMLTEYDPAPISGEIAQVIAEDCRAGNEDKIVYIGVGALQAVLLYLEGVLTLEALEASEETPDSIFAKVTIGGKEWTLRILEELDCRFAAFDADDQIV